MSGCFFLKHGVYTWPICWARVDLPQWASRCTTTATNWTKQKTRTTHEIFIETWCNKS